MQRKAKKLSSVTFTLISQKKFSRSAGMIKVFRTLLLSIHLVWAISTLIVFYLGIILAAESN